MFNFLKLIIMKKYDRLYNIWHFFKRGHNSLDLYNKIQKYPEMLIEDHEFKNGDMAMNILNIDLDFVESMFSDLTKFFEKLCECVFKENIETSRWNYDQYFENLVSEKNRGLQQSSGITYFLEGELMNPNYLIH